VKRKKGFTLIELMVVISIIAITATVASPNIKAFSSIEIKNSENLIKTKLYYMKNYCKNNYITGKIIINPNEIKGVTSDNKEVFLVSFADHTVISSDINEIGVLENGEFQIASMKVITVKNKVTERTLEVNSLSVKAREEK
jgi:prepilin-type N-terminal cleavage/methylation domain-containing protein